MVTIMHDLLQALMETPSDVDAAYVSNPGLQMCSRRIFVPSGLAVDSVKKGYLAP
jgi:hypothetical protein